MKGVSFSIIRRGIFVSLVPWVFLPASHADVPRKPPESKYAKLWNDSPFTSKPAAETGEPEANVFEDYALGGVSSIAEGYRVTLLHKNRPDERIYLETGAANEENFKILGVTKKPGDPLGTLVRLSRGSQSGVVAFDAKLLALKAPPAPRPTGPNGQPQGGRPGTVTPSQAGGGNITPQRQSRPRVIPPPSGVSAASSPQAPAGTPQNRVIPQPQQNRDAGTSQEQESRGFRRRR